MRLICDRGLNCYLSCVISIAAELGMNHPDAYAMLWSETDFDYDPEHCAYASKRILLGLEALGARAETLCCASPDEVEAALAFAQEGAPFIVGMDTFDIPWSPVYAHFHGTHYFLARKARQAVPCFDPTYGIAGAQMDLNHLLPHAFSISHLQIVPANPSPASVLEEARSILHGTPKVRESLLCEMDACRKERHAILPFAKRIEAMINNRHLFERFLHQPQRALDPREQLFSKAFLARWEAAKNGLYKAYIVQENENAIEEVRSLLVDLLREETCMAEEIIASARGFCAAD